MIPGGFILLARSLDNSAISDSPPHVREIWLYFLRMANYTDQKVGDKTIRRGQLLTTFKDIIEALSWKVGYRYEGYKKHHCETAMKVLTKAGMITSARTTRGVIVTICNYCHFQNSKNYETDSDACNDRCDELAMNTHDNKEVKEVKELKPIVEQKTLDVVREIITHLNHRAGKNFKPSGDATVKTIKARMSEGHTLEDFKKAIDNQCREWLGNDMEKYLRPDTLFRASKFDGYVNNSPSVPIAPVRQRRVLEEGYPG